MRLMIITAEHPALRPTWLQPLPPVAPVRLSRSQLPQLRAITTKPALPKESGELIIYLVRNLVHRLDFTSPGSRRTHQVAHRLLCR